jgi:hypothetical protein
VVSDDFVDGFKDIKATPTASMSAKNSKVLDLKARRIFGTFQRFVVVLRTHQCLSFYCFSGCSLDWNWTLSSCKNWRERSDERFLRKRSLGLYSCLGIGMHTSWVYAAA